MVGLALGLARMGLELGYPTPRCGVPDQRPWLLADIHYLHFAVLLSTITGAVVVGGSLMTSPSPPARVSRAHRTRSPRLHPPVGTPWLEMLVSPPLVHPNLSQGVPMGGSSPGVLSHQVLPISSCKISLGGRSHRTPPSSPWMAHPMDPMMVSVSLGCLAGEAPSVPHTPCL